MEPGVQHSQVESVSKNWERLRSRGKFTIGTAYESSCIQCTKPQKNQNAKNGVLFNMTHDNQEGRDNRVEFGTVSHLYIYECGTSAIRSQDSVITA